MKVTFTGHAHAKMRYYGISESLVKRVIRYPERIEEGILPQTVAAMRPAGSKKDRETWVMYVPDKKSTDEKGIRVITAWVYPGISPERDPVPENVLREVRQALSLF